MKAWNNKIWDFPRRRHGLILRELLDGEITGITASMFGPIWSDIKDESSDSERLPWGSRIGGPIFFRDWGRSLDFESADYYINVH